MPLNLKEEKSLVRVTDSHWWSDVDQQHAPTTQTRLQSGHSGRPSAVVCIHLVSVYRQHYTINQITEERSEYEDSEVNSNAGVSQCVGMTCYCLHTTLDHDSDNDEVMRYCFLRTIEVTRLLW